jgi:disulfide bond formation protein DsbB
MTPMATVLETGRASPSARLLAAPRRVAFSIGLVAVATIGGALVFEHGFGLQPCKLCLQQRIPYYLAIPLAFGVAALARHRPLARIGLVLLGLVFIASAGLGAYHAGVEWGWFAGPSDCAAASTPAAGSVGDFLRDLERTRVVSCTEAAWRFLGLSLAGWNVLISLGLAGLAFAGARAGAARSL